METWPQSGKCCKRDHSRRQEPKPVGEWRTCFKRTIKKITALFLRAWLTFFSHARKASIPLVCYLHRYSYAVVIVTCFFNVFFYFPATDRLIRLIIGRMVGLIPLARRLWSQKPMTQSGCWMYVCVFVSVLQRFQFHTKALGRVKFHLFISATTDSWSFLRSAASPARKFSIWSVSKPQLFQHGPMPTLP